MIGNDATPLVRCLLRAAQRGRLLRVQRERIAQTAQQDSPHTQADRARDDDDAQRQREAKHAPA